MGIRVAVAGASGYAGGELLRLLAGHPEFDLVAATAHSQAAAHVTAVHPQLAGLDLTLTATDASSLSDADLVFLALPHGQSAAVAAQLPAGVKVVDLGADFRLEDAALWERYYGGDHARTRTYGPTEPPRQLDPTRSAHRGPNTGGYAATT